MKKSERILELMMELEKELASLPEELQKLNKQMSEYDIVNSEMYHTLLSFNPSASESAKFVKNWKKALQERLEVKQEFQRLIAIQPELVNFLQRLTNIRVAVKSKGVAKGNPFTYRTEIGVGIIEDSFDSFEKRTTYPFKIAIEDFGESDFQSDFDKIKSPISKEEDSKRKVLNEADNTKEAQGKKVGETSEVALPQKEILSDGKIIETRPPKGHPAFIEMYNKKLYVLSPDGIHLAGGNWSDVFAYLKKHDLASVFIEKEAKKKVSKEIELNLWNIKKDSRIKKTLRNLLLSNMTKTSSKRQQQIKAFEEARMLKLGKYQLPGQSDQQKKSS